MPYKIAIISNDPFNDSLYYKYLLTDDIERIDIITNNSSQPFQQNKFVYHLEKGDKVEELIHELNPDLVICINSVLTFKVEMPFMYFETFSKKMNRIMNAKKIDITFYDQCMRKINAFEFAVQDTIEILRRKYESYEETLFLQTVQNLLSNKAFNRMATYSGKVRNVYDIGYNLLAMVATDKQSAFDRQICVIPNKGRVLNYASKFWFDCTRHIIQNHCIYTNDNIMIVKKCEPIMIEVVVRGYMTGSTNTSLWTHYSKGERQYCGITFPDGLKKNYKLPRNCVTPTTKGVTDELISAREIVEKGYVTLEEWKYIETKALELFAFGQMMADSRGFILVDTKYEFGRDVNGNIILMDEIHTCDSSRYWLKESYWKRIEKGEEPEKFDKDIIRDWVRKECDPYKDQLPEIPKELIDRTSKVYMSFYEKLTGETISNDRYKNLENVISNYFEEIHQGIAVIIAGSVTDEDWVKKISTELNKLDIYSRSYVASAHKNTRRVLEILDFYNSQRDRKVVFIAVAGRSNALGGVLAANSKYPVINCPPFKDKMDMMVNINSSIQNPSSVPAALILEPSNVAQFCKKML